MVEKFYAYYKGKKIDAYEGRRKKIRREIQTTPVSKAELFDSLNEEDRYPVTPKKVVKTMVPPTSLIIPIVSRMVNDWVQKEAMRL